MFRRLLRKLQPGHLSGEELQVRSIPPAAMPLPHLDAVRKDQGLRVSEKPQNGSVT